MSPNTSSTRIDAAKEAAAALDQGQLAVLRTETVYGVFARGDDPSAVQRIRALPRRPGTGSWGALTWHAPSLQAVIQAHEQASIELAPPLRRIMRRLWPGPVTLRLHTHAMDQLLPAIGLPQGVADIHDNPPATAHNQDRDQNQDQHRPDHLAQHPRAVLVRVPDDTWTAMTLQHAAGPVVGASAEPIDTGQAPPAPGTCPKGLEKLGIAVVQDDGPTRYARHSTILDAYPEGQWLLRAEGALSAQQIAERLSTLIVFVCTGNTCRSPMAQAIATSLLQRTGKAQHAQAVSAGVAAMRGARATPEAVRAAEAVGADLSQHRSQPATADLLERADAIYAMTASHAEAAKALLPPAQRSKVHLLDPAGDIEDPIGGPQALYDELARRFVGLIERRLEELRP